MKFIRYTILLIIIGSIQLLADWPLEYTPELIYIVAFASALNTNSKRALIAFFIAGVISDLFTGEHLGVNTLLYTTSAGIMLYFRHALHSRGSGLLQLLILALSLLYIYTFRVVLESFSLPDTTTIYFLLNNFFFSILIAPALSELLKLPIICPWKKHYS